MLYCYGSGITSNTRCVCLTFCIRQQEITQSLFDANNFFQAEKVLKKIKRDDRKVTH